MNTSQFILQSKIYEKAYQNLLKDGASKEDIFHFLKSEKLLEQANHDSSSSGSLGVEALWKGVLFLNFVLSIPPFCWIFQSSVKRSVFRLGGRHGNGK